MTKKKFQCKECGFYWEINAEAITPRTCNSCGSSKIYRSSHHKRFAKKARQKLRRSYSIR